MGGRSGWLWTAQAVTVAAGVSMGALATVATATADSGSTADSDASSVSAPRSPKTTVAGARDGAGPRRTDRKDRMDSTAGPGLSTAKRSVVGKRRVGELVEAAVSAEPAGGTQTNSAADSKAPADAVHSRVRPATDSGHAALEQAVVVTAPADETAPAEQVAVPVEQTVAAPPIAIHQARDGAQTNRALSPESRTEIVAVAAPIATGAVTAPAPTLIGTLSALVFGVFTSLERLLTGPASVPTGSTVTVQGSSLVVGGLTVDADWYFPASQDPPSRLILLQHGFLATGAMYSVTAARLAEDTNSIVVVPTLTSNPLADGGMWVNGPGMQQAVAALFYGNRAALTASALAAGYADRYGLDADVAVLPTKFVLAGHSAGGALVSVVAGYVAESDAADDLMGVLLLDGVTAENQLAPALAKLDDYQDRTDRYIPVREIGAPSSAWNSISTVNAALTAARPDRFNGVVLFGGVHTDSMGGGGVVAEFIFHVLAGFPTAQNAAALQQLAVSWVNDWFAGDTDVDDDLVHGSTISIATPAGQATAVVIGTAPVPSAALRAEAV